MMIWQDRNMSECFKVFYAKLHVHSLVDKLKWFYETARCYNKIYTHFTFNGFLFAKILPFIWDNMEKHGTAFRPHMAIWRTRTAYWIPRAIDTPSECLIRTAFPRQQWLRERPSVLRFHVHCLSPTAYVHRTFTRRTSGHWAVSVVSRIPTFRNEFRALYWNS